MSKKSRNVALYLPADPQRSSRKCRRTDRQTDGQTDRRTEAIIYPPSFGGGNEWFIHSHIEFCERHHCTCRHGQNKLPAFIIKIMPPKSYHHGLCKKVCSLWHSPFRTSSSCVLFQKCQSAKQGTFNLNVLLSF